MGLLDISNSVSTEVENPFIVPESGHSVFTAAKRL